MHTFMDAKLMAKLLRQALAERSIDVSHSDSLEFVARQFGVANWNILSAKIEAAGSADEVVPSGWSKSGNKPKAYRIRVDETAPSSRTSPASKPISRKRTFAH